jgi:hypothetical protein
MALIKAQSLESLASVLVVLVPAGKTEDSELHDFLLGSLSLELQNLGLVAIVKGEDVLYTGRSGDSALDALFRQAKDLEVDFAITCSYARKGKIVQLEFVWYDIQEEVETAAVFRETEIDLAFDQTVADAIKLLYYVIADRIQEIVAEKERLAAITPVTTGKIQGDPDSPSVVDTTPKRFAIFIGFAPFIPLGDAAAYFDTGYAPSFQGYYRIHSGIGIFGIGIHVGLNALYAAGTAAVSQITMIPLGLDLRYETSDRFFLGWVIHVNSGISLLMASFDGANPVMKIIPYVQVNTGFKITMGKVFSVSLDAGFAVYFEEPYPIMGLTPTLSCSIRL